MRILLFTLTLGLSSLLQISPFDHSHAQWSALLARHVAQGVASEVEHMGQRQIEHAQASMQRLQEQQSQRASVQQHPTDPVQHQPDPYEVQVMKAAAESQRKHD